MEERQLRKLKNFFDDKQKTKARLYSLYSFLEAAADGEVVELVRDHQPLLFQLFDAGYDRQRLKIAQLFNEKSSMSSLSSASTESLISSKHVVELFNLYSALRKILLIVCAAENERQLTDTSWISDTIVMQFLVRHLTSLLQFMNDHRIRIEGFRLALLCLTLSIQSSADNGLAFDFKSCRFVDLILGSIPLDPVKQFIANVGKPQNGAPYLLIKYHPTLYDGSVGSIAISNPQTFPVFSAEDLNEYFEELLYVIIAAASKNSSYYFEKAFISEEARLGFMAKVFMFFKTEFLHRVFSKYHSQVTYGPVFKRCPPLMLRSLASLLSRFSMKTSPHSCYDSLNMFMFAMPENFDYTREILNAGIRESPSYPRTIRYTLNVIKIWMLMPLREYPLIKIMCPGISDSSENNVNNLLVQECLKLVSLMFETAITDKELPDHSEMQKTTAVQTALFIEAISLFRNVVLSPCTLLEIDTCEQLQWTLLRIFDSLLNAGHSKSVLNGVMEYFVETGLTVWIRAATKQSELWTQLRQRLTRALEIDSVHTVIQWGKIMKSLAIIYGTYVLDFDVNTINQPNMRGRNRSMFLQQTASDANSKTTSFVEKASIAQKHATKRHVSDSFSLEQGVTETGASNRAASFSESPQSKIKEQPESVKRLVELSSYVYLDSLRQKSREHPDIYRDIDISDSALKLLVSLNRRTEQEFKCLDDMPFWNEFAATFMYRNMLRVIGNISSLHEAHIHYEAIFAISNVLDLFLQCKTHQPLNAPALPPLFEFCVWFVDTLDLPDKFSKSKSVALSNICKLLFRKMNGKKDEPDPPKAFYPRAISAIIKGLFTQEYDCINSVLGESTCMFGCNIPSIDLLLPVIVVCIYRWFSYDLPEGFEGFYDDIKPRSDFSSNDICNILKILFSVVRIAVSQAESEHTLPILISKENRIEKCGETSIKRLVPLIKELIVKIASEALSRATVDNELSHVSLCACTLVAHIELESRINMHGRYDQFTFETAINTILDGLNSENQQIILYAIDCMSCFTESSGELFKDLPQSIVKGVLEKYLGSIADNLYFNDQENQENYNITLPRLLYGVLDWLMILPEGLLGDFDLKTNIFEIVENILSQGNPKEFHEHISKKLQKSSGLLGSSRELASILSKSQTSSIIGSPSIEKRLNSGDVVFEDYNPVHEAAENLYLHLFHYYGNFPMPLGPATCSSYISEDGDGDSETINNLIGERAVVSLYDKIVYSIEINAKEAVVIIRNSLGKFGWTITPAADERQLVLKKSYASPPSRLVLDQHNISLPVEPEGSEGDAAEMKRYNAVLEAMKKESANDHEWNMYESLKYESKTVSDDEERHSCMSLLSVFNHLHLIDSYNSGNHANSGNREFKFLNHESAGLWRDIKGLDKKSGRECVKVAVVYVGPGQEDEYSILSNQITNTSSDFQDFISTLGWTIRVDTHPGFLAGLERSGATGKYATYYCTSTLEMIFHDVTQMPNDETDAKQVKKKRHIGNDHVHIVWNDNHRQYKANTIAGDFGNVQIIITPLSENESSRRNDPMYLIEIRKGGSEFFGPLVSSMVVSKYLLGRMVRMTAIHAYRASLNETNDGYKRPFHHRLSDIRMISSRHEMPHSTPLFQT